MGDVVPRGACAGSLERGSGDLVWFVACLSLFRGLFWHSNTLRAGGQGRSAWRVAGGGRVCGSDGGTV